MKLSARIEYACVALMQLAESWDSDEPVQVRRIAEVHGIPSKFLVQILLQLKSCGLVISVRGAGGGYMLNKPPQEVTLLEVLELMDGDDGPSTCCTNPSPFAAAFLSLRRDLGEQERDRLRAVTLADLVEQATVGQEPMWYI